MNMHTFFVRAQTLLAPLFFEIRGVEVDQNLDLIGSVEFGDWLINECEREALLALSGDEAARQAASVRLAALEQAKQLLLEFLTLQEEMMEFSRGEHSDPAHETERRNNSCTA